MLGTLLLLFRPLPCIYGVSNIVLVSVKHWIIIFSLDFPFKA